MRLHLAAILLFVSFGLAWGYLHDYHPARYREPILHNASETEKCADCERTFERKRREWKQDKLVGLSECEIRYRFGKPYKVQNNQHRYLPDSDQEWYYNTYKLVNKELEGDNSKAWLIAFKNGKCIAAIRGLITL